MSGRAVHGVLLAAGAGTRMGRPKALVEDERGPWLTRAVAALEDGGCAGVTVVLGAAVDDALPLLEGLGVDVVVAHDWAEGMGASLRAGLEALAGTRADAALVHLVDLPDVGPDVVTRVVATDAELARASYGGVPGHPVLLGRGHWPAVAAEAAGDEGARGYLRARRDEVVLVECGDLAGGMDVDAPPRAPGEPVQPA